MRAIVQDVYGSHEVLRLTEIEPPTIGADDVLARVRAAGVDPGVWHLMTGKPFALRLGFGLRAPRNPVRGLDFAGTIEAVGANVTRVRVGDEVFGVCDGSFADYARTTVDRIAPKPASLTFQEAAAVPVSGVTALHALREKGKIKSGQRVLIIGAGGGVGTFAVQLAKAFGAKVTGVCGTSKVELVRSIGADSVIDYTRGELAAPAEPYHLIVDGAGNRPLSGLRRLLTRDGTLVIVGGEGGGPLLGGAGRTLRAQALSGFVSQKLVGLFASTTTADLRVLTQLIDAGKLRPVIDRRYGLDEVPAAIASWESGHARGKSVITLAS